ncbi:SCAN domain-containing protein 3 [Trichonephila clavipes]|nr:SCAN domain-containing protein 3 [Trichonephila clavipes]
MASFVFSPKRLVAKRGKPYTVGEYIKNCFINASEELFQDFKNKADILKRIKELPLSAKTMKDRTIKMCSNITTQHIKDLQLVSALSIAVDESCDINDTAEVSLFVRFVSPSGPKEELLGLLPLKDQTRGEDIANAVIECMDKHIIFPSIKLCRFQQMGPKMREPYTSGTVVTQVSAPIQWRSYQWARRCRAQGPSSSGAPSDPNYQASRTFDNFSHI